MGTEYISREGIEWMNKFLVIFGLQVGDSRKKVYHVFGEVFFLVSMGWGRICG